MAHAPRFVLREVRVKKGEQLVISKFKASQECVGHLIGLSADVGYFMIVLVRVMMQAG